MGIQLNMTKMGSSKDPVIGRDTIPYFRKKLIRNIRDYGIWISCKKAFAYAIQPIYRKIVYYLYELDLNQHASKKNVASQYKYKLVSPNDDQIIHQIERMEEWLSGSFKNKLQNNCMCMVVMDGTKVIGFNYAAIGEGNIPLLSLKVIIGPTEAWSEQITISADYRRQGLASALRDKFYQELKSHGITNLYGHRQEFNVASKQSARKFTKGVMVRAEYRRVFGIRRLRCMKVTNEKPNPSKGFYLRPAGTAYNKEIDPQPIDHKNIFIAKIADLK